MISFDSQTNIFKYGGMVCIDIREKDRGFVYYEAAKKKKIITASLETGVSWI